MTTKQQNFLTMAHAVNEVLKKYNSKWAHVQRFALSANELNTLVELTTIANAKADSDNTGVTLDKHSAARRAIKEAINLGKRASVYARDKENMGMHEKLRFNRWELERLHDTEALAKLREVYGLLLPVVNELADYAILESDLQNYKKLVDHYDQMLTKPRELTSARKTLNTQLLPQNVKKMKEILFDLSDIMNLFEHTPFYGDFFNARKIIELGTRGKKDEPKKPEEPKEPEQPGEGGAPPEAPETK